MCPMENYLTWGDLEHSDYVKREDCTEIRIDNSEKMGRIESDIYYLKRDVKEVKMDVKDIKISLEKYIFKEKMKKEIFSSALKFWKSTTTLGKIVIISTASLTGAVISFFGVIICD
jgi:hypothetical protein